MKLVSILACLALTLLSVYPRALVPEELAANGSPLHLSVAHQRIDLGDTIQARVELCNHTDIDVFVPRKFNRSRGFMSYLELLLEDSEGRISPMMIGHSTRVPADPNESFASALARDWVALPPKYCYGTTLEVGPEEIEWLRKPGRYNLKATYVSLGMGAPLYYNRLPLSPEDLAMLPFSDWKGQIQSNSVWIEIVPSKDEQ